MAKDYIRWVPGPRTMKWMSRIHTALYRATGGLVGARADGLDMLLLTSRGHRSGALRTTPLPYFVVGDDLVLIASFGGNPKDPAWVANLTAEPKARIQVGREKAEVEARVLRDGPERYALWHQITTDHPRYLEYQQRTERTIPLVVLSRAASLAA